MKILYFGEVGDNQSWGITTIGNVTGLVGAGHRVWLRAKNTYGNVPTLVANCMAYSFQPDVFINVGLANMMGDLSALDRKIKRVGQCCWDSSLVPENGCDYLNKEADGVIALSQFTKKAFLDGGLKIPIHVGGIGVDTDLFQHIHRNPFRKPYTFVFTGVAQGRKGTQGLITAFESVLGDNKDAQLIIKSNSWGKLDDYTVKCSNVKRIKEEYSRDQIAKLYHDSDCFVCPSHGDSFLMPGLEAMSTGLPLIITDFGGPRDYCTKETGYPVKYMLKDAGYIPGHQAEPDIDDLAQKMLYVFEHPHDGIEKGNKGADIARERWTWQHDANNISKFLGGLI